jgi:hypothetical protein
MTAMSLQQWLVLTILVAVIIEYVYTYWKENE